MMAEFEPRHSRNGSPGHEAGQGHGHAKHVKHWQDAQHVSARLEVSEHGQLGLTEVGHNCPVAMADGLTGKNGNDARRRRNRRFCMQGGRKFH